MQREREIEGEREGKKEIERDRERGMCNRHAPVEGMELA